MNKTLKKTLTGVTSAAMLTSTAAQAVVAETDMVVSVSEQEAVSFKKVANVEGTFSFNQNMITPADDVFSLFGTAVTGLCAKPDFAMSSADKDYYVNVGGKISYSGTRNLKAMAGQNRTMLCACATGPATAQAQITGVPVSDVLSLSDLDLGTANTLVVKSADGYTAKLPLQVVLEKNAMLAYQVGGKDIPSGVQLWMPDTVAKYFVRNVVDLEVTSSAEVPKLDSRDESLKAEIALMNKVEDIFTVGKTMTFEGYADDFEDAIAAIEFSMDGGETWTSYPTEKVSTDLWVYWHFSYTPTSAGSYQMTVRARTASGKVSPLAANVAFTVAESV